MKHSTQQSGFTFIELMVITVIIGIVSSIAMKTYQGYIARVQVTAGLAEIYPARTMLETRLNDDANAEISAIIIGLQSSTENCLAITAHTNEEGAGKISCTHRGSSYIHGRTSTLNRSTLGKWHCTSTVEAEYTTAKCSGV
ncbi:MAG: prepilin-type N-terminal cleavage/methylation domain-containing protein [Methyloprofundus sp.]|nr:prepilin-type N-terminal cleavage/methylation domain-containing protein [Methyloprofundus sp.]